MTMELVLGGEHSSLLIGGHPQHYTFAGVKTHLPSYSQCCQIVLEKSSVSVVPDDFKQKTGNSSAKSFACEDFIDSGRSLMKHRNKRGPRTVP